MRIKSLIILSLALLPLLSCYAADTDSKPKQKTAKRRQFTPEQRVRRIVSWDARGAMSLTMRGKTNMGSFYWYQRGPFYTLRTAGALNITGWHLKGGPRGVTLLKGGNSRRSARTPEALMKRELGWSLPMSNFRYWSRGLPAPKAKTQFVKRDRFGHIRVLKQQGWTIRYLSYVRTGGRDLPRSMVFINHRVRLKLVVKKWKILRG